MGEGYCEDLVRKLKTTKENLLFSLLLLMVIVSLFLFLFITPWGGAILLVVSVPLTWLAARDRVVEYEYLIIGSEVEVSKIKGKSKRKKLCTFDLNNVVSVMPSNSKRLEGEKQKYSHIGKRDFSSGIDNGNRYSFILEKEGDVKEFIMEPSKKSMEHMKPYIRTKMHQD